MIQIVRFHYPYAGPIALPAHYCRVGLARVQRPDNRRLQIVARRQSTRRDLRLLRRVIPVVITEEKRATLEKIERRVRERSRDAKRDEVFPPAFPRRMDAAAAASCRRN